MTWTGAAGRGAARRQQLLLDATGSAAIKRALRPASSFTWPAIEVPRPGIAAAPGVRGARRVVGSWVQGHCWGRSAAREAPGACLWLTDSSKCAGTGLKSRLGCLKGVHLAIERPGRAETRRRCGPREILMRNSNPRARAASTARVHATLARVRGLACCFKGIGHGGLKWPLKHAEEDSQQAP